MAKKAARKKRDRKGDPGVEEPAKNDATIGRQGEADKVLAVGEAEAEKLRALREKFKRLYDEIRQRLSVLKNTELQVKAVHEILGRALIEHAQAQESSEVKEGPDDDTESTEKEGHDVQGTEGTVSHGIGTEEKGA